MEPHAALLLVPSKKGNCVVAAPTMVVGLVVLLPLQYSSAVLRSIATQLCVTLIGENPSIDRPGVVPNVKESIHQS